MVMPRQIASAQKEERFALKELQKYVRKLA
jgi:hypothetical protein